MWSSTTAPLAAACPNGIIQHSKLQSRARHHNSMPSVYHLPCHAPVAPKHKQTFSTPPQGRLHMPQEMEHHTKLPITIPRGRNAHKIDHVHSPEPTQTTFLTSYLHNSSFLRIPRSCGSELLPLFLEKDELKRFLLVLVIRRVGDHPVLRLLLHGNRSRKKLLRQDGLQPVNPVKTKPLLGQERPARGYNAAHLPGLGHGCS